METWQAYDEAFHKWVAIEPTLQWGIGFLTDGSILCLMHGLSLKHSGVQEQSLRWVISLSVTNRVCYFRHSFTHEYSYIYCDFICKETYIKWRGQTIQVGPTCLLRGRVAVKSSCPRKWSDHVFLKIQLQPWSLWHGAPITWCGIFCDPGAFINSSAQMYHDMSYLSYFSLDL